MSANKRDTDWACRLGKYKDWKESFTNARSPWTRCTRPHGGLVQRRGDQLVRLYSPPARKRLRSRHNSRFRSLQDSFSRSRTKGSKALTTNGISKLAPSPL